MSPLSQPYYLCVKGINTGIRLSGGTVISLIQWKVNPLTDCHGTWLRTTRSNDVTKRLLEVLNIWNTSEGITSKPKPGIKPTYICLGGRRSGGPSNAHSRSPAPSTEFQRPNQSGNNWARDWLYTVLLPNGVMYHSVPKAGPWKNFYPFNLANVGSQATSLLVFQLSRAVEFSQHEARNFTGGLDMTVVVLSD